MGDCKAVSTPLEPRAKFTCNERNTMVNTTEYRSLFGSLRYLTHTRPNLLYSVGILSRFMENPAQEHFNGVKRVLRYVKGTIDFGLFYKKGDLNTELMGFSDSDFAGDVSDRRSTSGYIFFLNGMAVRWSSQKQHIVALSSCEAEYIAATEASCQAIWMNRWISEMKGEGQKPVKLMVENQLAITLSKNPVHHNRTKHIGTRYHFIRLCVEERKIEICYVPMEDQLADIFTKALGKLKFEEMRGRIGVQCLRTEELEQGGD
ncbi:secreted RxLR effector protein 161-like [Wolffia australiana]